MDQGAKPRARSGVRVERGAERAVDVKAERVVDSGADPRSRSGVRVEQGAEQGAEGAVDCNQSRASEPVASGWQTEQ